MRRLATLALVSLLAGQAAAAAAQDFVVGVHAGSTNTRQLSSSGYSAFERGASIGLSGAIAMKPWLALQLELLWADKGLLGRNSGPHRYFEVPYMVKLASPRPLFGIRPFGLWGAAQAYELTCVADCASAERVTTDVSIVSGWGASAELGRFELAVERRHARGQNSLTRNAGRITSDVRTLVLRLSIVIPGVVPDWM